MDLDQQAGVLRDRISKAQMELEALVERHCPGPHIVKQHRDRKPPWCKACGRDDHGVVHQDQTTG